MSDSIDYRSKRAQSSRGRRNVAAKPADSTMPEDLGKSFSFLLNRCNQTMKN